METEARKKLLIIDGNSLIYRAFYALPPLQSSRGEHTNATYGFTNMLFKLLEDEKPHYLVVAMDHPAPSFRHGLYAEYKGHREKTPDELREQVQRIRDILEAMRVAVLEVEGYEADDIIGTLSAFAGKSLLETTVVTGDADLLQLVGDEGVTVMLTRTGITQMDRYDRGKLAERYGLEPWQMIDYKALKGDPSDNIPGVPGIGDKTARRLLQEYGTLERLYENLDKLGGKLRQNLEQYRDQLFTGRRLVSLCRDVPLTFALEQYIFEPDYRRLAELFAELEFKSLSARVRELMPEAPSREADICLKGEPVASTAGLARLLEELQPDSLLVVLVEPPAGRPYWREPLAAIALAPGGEKGYYLNLEKFEPGEEAAWKALARAWERGVTVCCHDSKYLANYLHERGLREPSRVFDIQLAAYLLDPARSSYDLPYLFQQYLNRKVAEEEKGGRKGPRDPEQEGLRLASWACNIIELKERLEQSLAEQSLDKLYYDLELPLAGVLARMERRGMAVDLTFLQDYAAEIHSRLETLEEEIYRLAGERFNLNSPQQLSAILFEKLKLPVVRKTKTGLSTDAKVLEELAPRHEIVAKILYYRQLIKLEGTYLSGLAPLVDPVKKKIFTTLNQTVTATGRLSSSEPNLQNIPIRMEEGRRIRRAFIPSQKGYLFLTADYSQIELRVLAHLSQDPILVEAFRQDEDIHRRTAAEVFGVPPEEVTEAMRKKAKAVNFGIIYGISDYGLAQNLGVSRQEARRYIDSYFERYQGVKQYGRQVIEQARECGFVTTLLSRRRYLPELRLAHYGQRSFAERIARNTPIQGSAADIIKLAMLRIDEVIRQGGFKAAMLLQIHDELLFELPEEELPFFAPVLRREMEQAVSLNVPLKVDLEWGRNWDELQPL